MAAAKEGSGYPKLSPHTTSGIAERLTEIVSLQHGQSLSADHLLEVRERIDAQLAAAERLHSFPLSNDQEPIFVIRADEPGMS
jgi:hypothetical protein